MSNGSKQFTEEEKAAIALKAVSGDEETIRNLADEHGVSVDDIQSWIRETGVTPVNTSDDDEVTIEASEEYAQTLEYGASFDMPNYKRIVFWSAFGSAVVLLIIVSIFYVHNYTASSAADVSAQTSQFYEIEQMKERDQATLNSFGVVDPEEGIYRIPIDRAISSIVNEQE
jgi:hypothetical protein